ncbi:putative bifunctional diguanylate cyclase/phosphodiesterase [Daeguia caeni]|uniref:Bifunctional diguanylate cyclase/phosphodiesterase n=1 Tax=Daeguia caeni TaxID=439612 RepID=A0ABV9H3S6_9HYPH
MKRVLSAIIVCLIIATAYIAYVIAERQTSLQKVATYNDSWTVSQTVAEFLRLEHRLGALALGIADVSREEVRLRIDFMISRFENLEQGRLGAFIAEDPERRALIAQLKSLIMELDNKFDSMTTEDIKAFLHRSSELDSPMVTLSSISVLNDVSLIQATQNEIRRLHHVYTALSFGFVLSSITLIALLRRHNILLDRTRDSLQSMTADLQHASEQLKQQNYRLEHEAHHDALTGLPNRVMFRENLTLRLEDMMKSGKQAAIFLLDLDNFKDVNDTLGHDAGDALLQEVSRRLTEFNRNDNMVCRLGGDEFVIVTSNMTMADSKLFADRLLTVIGKPYRIGGYTHDIGTCIGIALSTPNIDPETMFKHADLALYEAKAMGANHACIFQPEMLQRLQEKKAFEADLQVAMQNNEMEVYYQPQVMADTGEICGYEALLRWTHPVRGMVSPAEFIPVAERIGMIVTLGEWVLRQACMEAASWTKPLTIAVNLSPVQFRHIDLISSVEAVLKETGLDPHRLELEITESVLLDDNQHTLELLQALKRLGIKITMDDFGTGYSSLANMSAFPYDKIKIDRSFISQLVGRADIQAIVGFIIGVGRTLGMVTIAEGVETEEQYAQLKLLGCDQLQGFLLGCPAPASQLQALHGDSSVHSAQSEQPQSICHNHH